MSLLRLRPQSARTHANHEAYLVCLIGERRDLQLSEADNPSAVIYVDERIVAALCRLLDSPRAGRVDRIAITRELVIFGASYVGAYAVTGATARILRVLHGAQEWPDNLLARPPRS